MSRESGRHTLLFRSCGPGVCSPRIFTRPPIEYCSSMQRVDEIAVRPFSSRAEYELMLDYFYKADDAFLRRMGVDRLKLPQRDKWLDALLVDHEKLDKERDRFYLAWIFRGQPVGHSSINRVVPGTEAFIH